MEEFKNFKSDSLENNKLIKNPSINSHEVAITELSNDKEEGQLSEIEKISDKIIKVYEKIQKIQYDCIDLNAVIDELNGGDIDNDSFYKNVIDDINRKITSLNDKIKEKELKIKEDREKILDIINKN